ncbi:LacI family transcriptional regulator [Rhodococcus sp. WMMA185]|uniref:LacI family DNA-binding transcriptional regulator n=1 Tax=Rhodococcus sp. WMMA185 TaxID=679318 RepID=UPI0008783B2D|nr:LacI family DNA-binding transcriptional regulator [Rhodococcus sp. WMMA185]AOW92555.1 LacI family transcriptional regulator [Rhodococcus sp. WMMA185]
MKRVTLSDVSQHAGVSRSTASLVLNNSASVAPETSRRVRESMKALGYVYNRHAAMLRNPRSMTLGLVVTEVQNPYFAELAMTLEDVADGSDYAVFVGYSRDDPARQRRLLGRFVERSIDGLILLPASDTRADEIDDLLATSAMPLVLLARHFDLSHDYVGADNVEAGRLLGEHLREMGVRTVAMVGGPQHTSARREREEGFHAAIAGAEMSIVPPDGLFGEATPGGGAEATRRLLDRGTIPDAIVAYSDIVAVGVYAELSRRGLEPGRDIAVGGFDDIAGSAHRTPPLTTVATFPTEIGQKCGKLILERIRQSLISRGRAVRDSRPHTHDLVTPALRVRGSTAAWRPRR